MSIVLFNKVLQLERHIRSLQEAWELIGTGKITLDEFSELLYKDLNENVCTCKGHAHDIDECPDI